MLGEHFVFNIFVVVVNIFASANNSVLEEYHTDRNV